MFKLLCVAALVVAALAQDCFMPPYPDNALRMGTNADGDILIYSCMAGYKLVGPDSNRCIHGIWETSNPTTCVADAASAYCGDPGYPDLGFTSGTNFGYGGVVSYACFPGYNLNGPTTRTCQADGTWSGAEPTCAQLQCSDPSTPDHATRTGSSFAVDAVLTFACETGYSLTGASTITCLFDGTWSAANPVCSPIECPAPDFRAHAIVSGNATVLGSTISYSCEAGFLLIGDASITCQPTGLWSADAPVCATNLCADPGAPVNGARTLKEQAAVTYTCNTGFTLVGDAVRTCQSDATWTGTAPTCTQVDCGALAQPTNGAISATGTTFGNTATATCQTGYTLGGTATRTCGADGKWTGSDATCTLVSCAAPTVPDNGHVLGAGFSYGATITLNCDAGFHVDGEASQTCGADGNWSPATLGTCTADGTNSVKGATEVSPGTRAEFSIPLIAITLCLIFAIKVLVA